MPKISYKFREDPFDRYDRLAVERPGKIIRALIVGGTVAVAAAGYIGYNMGVKTIPQSNAKEFDQNSSVLDNLFESTERATSQPTSQHYNVQEGEQLLWMNGDRN